MADTDVGKLFVGGISRDTTDVTLRDHFSKYGVVSYSVIARDRLTGLPRGFGFITFSDPSSVNSALLDSNHLINGRTVEVKRAIPRKEQVQQQPPQQQQPQQMLSPVYSQTTKPLGRNSDANGNNHVLKAKKIFVGGLSSNLTEEEFRVYFEKFGKITDVVVMHDNNTNRPRGFGFITFESEEVVEKIMQKSHHELAGKRVEVKRAVPREATKNLNNASNSRSNVGMRFLNEANSYITMDGTSWPRSPAYPGQLPISTAYPGYYYNSGDLYTGGYPMGGGYSVFGYGLPVFPVPGRAVNYGTGYYPAGVNVNVSGAFPVMGMVSPYGGFMDPGVNVRANSQMYHRVPNPHMNGSRSGLNGPSLKTGGNGELSMKKSQSS